MSKLEEIKLISDNIIKIRELASSAFDEVIKEMQESGIKINPAPIRSLDKPLSINFLGYEIEYNPKEIENQLMESDDISLEVIKEEIYDIIYKQITEK